jgi:hypothetical protein
VRLQLPKRNGPSIPNDTLVDYGNGVAEEESKEDYAAAVKGGDYSRIGSVTERSWEPQAVLELGQARSRVMVRHCTLLAMEAMNYKRG